MSEKLKRRENFSQEEKEIIINYVKKNGTILEDKSGNAKMHIAKKKKWKELEEELKALGSTRTWAELRTAYQCWKVMAKKNVTAYRKYLKSTGGGPHPFKSHRRWILTSRKFVPRTLIWMKVSTTVMVK